MRMISKLEIDVINLCAQPINVVIMGMIINIVNWVGLEDRLDVCDVGT
jgi:hypothetical protein